MEQKLLDIYQQLQSEYPDHPCVRLVEAALKALREGNLRRACELAHQALACLTEHGISLPPGLVEWEMLYCGIE
jgi:hypothetical protein